MPAIRAFHIISTTYGTWLPGDPDKPGHWSPLFDLYGRVRGTGGQLNLPDAPTFEVARDRVKDRPKVLDEYEQQLVVETIRDVICGDGDNSGEHGRTTRSEDVPRKRGAECEEVIPRCRVFALAVEPTHFHLLIGPLPRESIGEFVGRLKGRSSSVLLNDIPENWGRKRIWTRGYWKVFLFEDFSISLVRKYIEAHNTRRGRPANPYPDWVG